MEQIFNLIKNKLEITLNVLKPIHGAIQADRENGILIRALNTRIDDIKNQINAEKQMIQKYTY